MPRVLNISELRKKPWPENAVYIGRSRRGSNWGNPFVMRSEKDRLKVINQYRDFLLSKPDLIEKAQKELRGKDLVCYCAPKFCHGDILLEIANG